MGTAGAVLVCKSDSQQIVAMQYRIMCLCVYICIPRMYKCSTCSFNVQLCNSPLYESQPVKDAALYSSFAKNPHVWSMHVVVASHNIPPACQMVGFTITVCLRDPSLVIGGKLITLCTLELGHPHHKIYTDVIQMRHLNLISTL